MYILQEEIIPKYNFLLGINFPNEQELKEKKGLKDLLELTKTIIDSYSDILQSSMLQKSGVFVNEKIKAEEGNDYKVLLYEKLKGLNNSMMEEAELNEQRK
ncbi:hypothetical protein MYP_3516 [Sporocytophaga myxococcoides]|uniref:Uncharacterized protein n=2 Tax=Sporocytophaga myxococcoides TaxID=153721 RepID=A0A098LIT3_9BACT|nr:hypothetical protein MYP_3516 [Sporocytophaga myxococcoides]